MTPVERDTDRAIMWLVDLAIGCTRKANEHDDVRLTIMDKVETIAACAALPNDLPLRVRIFPNVFNLLA
jgi:hypothetical protein